MSDTDEKRDAVPALRHRWANLAVHLRRQLRPALVGLVALTLITGGLYPVVLLGAGRLLFPRQADGSLLVRDRVVIGSSLIGQRFTRPEYFQPRPSAAGSGYEATQSGGANLAPGNPKLVEAVRQAADQYRRLNGLAPTTPLPIDAVTTSASGLDPDISPQNAQLQAPRVAHARGVSLGVVRRMIADNTRGRDLGVLGAPRVSVLELNLALDRLAPLPRQ